jgi:hypothetical protein
MSGDVLSIAHRVWAVPTKERSVKSRSKKKPSSSTKKAPKRRTRASTETPEPEFLLALDTETTIDSIQQLTFGSWRFFRIVDDELLCLEEGLFYDDLLPTRDPAGFEVLCQYASSRPANTERPRGLRLLSRTELVEKVFYKGAYVARARVVGFNLPFDLSRLAVAVKEGRGRNFGGFSFILWPGKKDTDYDERRHRPRINIKSLETNGAFISFGSAFEVDEADMDHNEFGEPDSDKSHYWPGRFLDLSTLAAALTGRPYSLDAACSAFGVQGKSESGRHGRITPEYIDYNRQDVAATVALYEALMEEFRRHPINLAPEKAFSSASLSKAYLTAMDITPLLDRHPDFPPEVNGFAMAAFFGGRAVTSMYPTVDDLMDLHRFQLARRIEAVDTTDEVRIMLESVTLEDCLDQELWPKLVGFALTVPDADVLPVRAAYNETSWGIGVNPLASDEPLWYSLADLVASKLLTGRAPHVMRAIRLVARGGTVNVRTVKVRGTLEVDPSLRDPMVAMTEERQRVKNDPHLSAEDRERLSLSIKIIVNAGAYGIYSEFNPRERRCNVTTPVRVHGRNDAFSDRVAAPEDPGEYCFPPFASCITGAARLFLTVIERLVTDRGGTWAFCDTDSMAIVASEHGGLVACPGGPYVLPDGSAAIGALSYGQVEEIREIMNRLNPYDRSTVPDILKLEATATCFAISAKRYALYDLDDGGIPVFLDDHKPSESGLGHYLNPDDPDTESKEWIKPMWRVVIARGTGQELEMPSWFRRPTMTKTAVTSVAVQRAFRHLNEGRSYSESVKPFNFMLSAAGARPPAGVTIGSPFRLVAPFETDANKWVDLSLIDTHNPAAGPYHMTTTDGRPGMARVDTFEEVLAKYETHPEMKSLGPNGEVCGRSTIGLLQRRPMTAGKIILIGKEANRIEERRSGASTLSDRESRVTTYDDDDEWKRFILPKLRSLGAKNVAEIAKVSDRRARDWLKERAVPRLQHRNLLFTFMKEIGGWSH